ncbi:MAG: DinB family protein [Candidatus Doudnabacteria bacterium]
MFTSQYLIPFLEKEYKLTQKALRAFPAEQMDYQPHPKSMSIKQLMRAFGADLSIANLILKGEEITDPYAGVPEITDPEQAAQTIDDLLGQLVETLKQTNAEDLNKDLELWGQTHTVAQWVLAMLSDTIHHRGQLTVYIRLAGGLVPSIYGPSADEQ